MAASIYTLGLSNGQSLSVYQGISQPKYSALCVRVLNSPDDSSNIVDKNTDFTVSSEAYIVHIDMPATLTAGGFEIYDVTAGRRTLVSPGIRDFSVFRTDKQAELPLVTFHPGRTYRLFQTTPGNP